MVPTMLTGFSRMIAGRRRVLGVVLAGCFVAFGVSCSDSGDADVEASGQPRQEMTLAEVTDQLQALPRGALPQDWKFVTKTSLNASNGRNLADPVPAGMTLEEFQKFAADQLEQAQENPSTDAGVSADFYLYGPKSANLTTPLAAVGSDLPFLVVAVLPPEASDMVSPAAEEYGLEVELLTVADGNVAVARGQGVSKEVQDGFVDMVLGAQGGRANG